MSGFPCTPELASCLIPNLITELRPPCPLSGGGGLLLRGMGYNGQEVTVRVLKDAIEIEGVPRSEVEAIIERRCFIDGCAAR